MCSGEEMRSLSTRSQDLEDLKIDLSSMRVFVLSMILSKVRASPAPAPQGR